MLSLHIQMLLFVSLGLTSIAKFSEFKGYNSCSPGIVFGGGLGD